MSGYIQSSEIQFNEMLTKYFVKSPLQLNKVNESDAEIFRLPNCETILAATTDIIQEEIEFGIYDDPYLIGWMVVTINISDLLAVGSKPLFILLNETFPSNSSQEYIDAVQKGIAEACDVYAVSVLGGDTNFSEKGAFGATAIGIIADKQKILTRKGCNEGDYIIVSGPLGIGNFHALLKITGQACDAFKPKPNCKSANLISRFASSCIDTSDGFVAALMTIAELNDIGANLNTDIIESVIPDFILEYCIVRKIHPWLMLAGIVGEYELLFTIRSNDIDIFLKESESISFKPQIIGRVKKENTISIKSGNNDFNIDCEKIKTLHRNLIHTGFDLYVNELARIFECLN
ncbi:thiamine-phosphate kinase [Mucilaginibacter paludis]|uniref:Thiamine-monophosphate kinase n=1 Tax=Mucilaginibacter paludis DSM 18603 TaxID=714943 RepID=H1Y3X7_9SPHI|nr:thiamine-phosphate kinase [Mucilaginibacter paludis]EHQ30922.1 AIR synthase related protein [Mucilaginibacter paludis DSM 18603]